MRLLFVLFCLILITACQNTTIQKSIPAIDGEWWPVTGNPDLGEYTDEDQQPVDFGVWQAKWTTALAGMPNVLLCWIRMEFVRLN